VDGRVPKGRRVSPISLRINVLVTESLCSAFTTSVNDGTIKIRAGDWPWFLYDNSEELDLDEQEKGLCQGYILLRVSI
jgi:hypothetical protein